MPHSPVSALPHSPVSALPHSPVSALPHSPVSALPHEAIRDLQRPLARAQDAMLAEVVSLVDSMADRGVADALIAPLRPRLQMLRPARRLNLSRLLFMPADPIIVPATQWRRKALTVPRSALGCLAAHVIRALGDEAGTLSAELAGGTCSDHGFVLARGRGLWPIAADTLAAGGMPRDWAASTGLSAADHADITRPLAVLLRQGVAIEAMAQRRFAGPDTLAGPLRACLASAIADTAGTAHAQQALAMLISVLLARLDATEQVITAAGDLAASLASPSARQASDMAIDLLLDRAEAAPAANPDLGEATEALDRIAALLEALEQPGPSHRPACKPRVAQLRRDLDTACRARFDREITNFRAGQSQPQTGRKPDDEAAAQEATALALRCFELTSRAFGSAAHYERLVHDTARGLAAAPPTDAGAMDRARLLEILQGPHAALDYLNAATGV